MLTAIFAVYIGLGYVLLGIPRDAWRDILIYVEFFLTFAVPHKNLCTISGSGSSPKQWYKAMM